MSGNDSNIGALFDFAVLSGISLGTSICIRKCNSEFESDEPNEGDIGELHGLTESTNECSHKLNRQTVTSCANAFFVGVTTSDLLRLRVNGREAGGGEGSGVLLRCKVGSIRIGVGIGDKVLMVERCFDCLFFLLNRNDLRLFAFLCFRLLLFLLFVPVNIDLNEADNRFLRNLLRFFCDLLLFFFVFFCLFARGLFGSDCALSIAGDGKSNVCVPSTGV